jgi:hypothetical protein
LTASVLGETGPDGTCRFGLGVPNYRTDGSVNTLNSCPGRRAHPPSVSASGRVGET